MRLVSFNLLHGMGLDGRVDPARVQDAVRSLDADVLALQEVDRRQPRSHRLDLVRLVAEAVGADGRNARFVPSLIGTPGLRWRSASPGEEPAEAAYGIGLVSRLPIRSWHPLALGTSPMRLPVLIEAPRRRVVLVRDEPRVAVAAVLEQPAAVATVVSTHLSFAPGWNAVQLRRLARALRPFPAPVVVLGDLNLPGRLPAGILPGWRMLGRAATYPAGRPHTQLDHALLRTVGRAGAPTVRSFEALPTAVSDHRALVVELHG
jgi:endonuclease/exonuclease/phosphatase family metal-dependent hydrolase